MKPKSETSPPVQPGTFVSPTGANIRVVRLEEASAREGISAIEASAIEVWREVGPCLAYPKPDGWRFQVHKVGETIKLFSRTGRDWAKAFHSVVQSILAKLPDERAILDTELVGFDSLGRHLKPNKLPGAARYRCYVLDALYLNGLDLTSPPAKKRVPYIWEHLHDVFGGMFVFAEYTYISYQEQWVAFYQSCLYRRVDGFDGAIIKQLDAPYFVDVLKVKPEETVDAVVIGAFLKGGVVSSLLLVAPDSQQHWMSITEVHKHFTDWNNVWPACQSHIVDHRPPNLGYLPNVPHIWVLPKVVVEVKLAEWRPPRPSSPYPLRTDRIKRCTLREDKGPEAATAFEQVLQMAGVPHWPLGPAQLTLSGVMNFDSSDRDKADKPGQQKQKPDE